MREPVTSDTLRAFMRALAAEARQAGRIYLTGGASAVLQGWRLSTVDVDMRIVPENDRVLRAIPPAHVRAWAEQLGIDGDRLVQSWPGNALAVFHLLLHAQPEHRPASVAQLRS